MNDYTDDSKFQAVFSASNLIMKNDGNPNQQSFGLSQPLFKRQPEMPMRKATKSINIQKSSGNQSIFGAIADIIKSTFITNSANVYAAYVPKLQTFGKIHNNVNLKVKSNNNTDYDVTVKKLTFEVEPYSLELSGDLQQKGQQRAYNAKLALNGYGIILNDVFGYAQRNKKRSRFIRS